MLVAKGNLYRNIADEKLSKYQNDGWERVGADGKKVKSEQKKDAARIKELEAALMDRDNAITELTSKVTEFEAALMEKQ